MALTASTASAVESQCINNKTTSELQGKIKDLKSTPSQEGKDYIAAITKNIKKYQYQLSQENDKKGYDQDVYCAIQLADTYVSQLQGQLNTVSNDINDAIPTKQIEIEAMIEAIQKMEASTPVKYPEACANSKPPQGTVLLTQGVIDKSLSKYVFKNLQHTDGVLLSEDTGLIGSTKKPVISATSKGKAVNAWAELDDAKKPKEIVCISNEYTPKGK